MSQYSYRLGSANCPLGTTTGIYTVPAGYFAIIRCIDCVAAGPGSTGAVEVGISGVNWLFQGFYTATVPWLGWRGRQVMKAGEGLSVLATTVSSWVTASGYVFPSS